MAVRRIVTDETTQQRRHNTIVTRGFGRHNNIVTLGFVRGFIGTVTEQTIRLINLGQSGAKRVVKELEEVLIWAKLVGVNDDEPKERIEGSIRVRIDAARHISLVAERVAHGTRRIIDDIKVTVRRWKR
jgi:hypothetical protein